jgi:hypothetical protein
MALTQVAGGLLAGGITSSQITSVSGASLTGTQNIPKATLPTGSVLQVVMATYQGEVTTTSGTFQTTNFSGTITPISATSKILVQAVGEAKVQSGTTNLITFYRNGSNVVAQHLVQHSSAGDYVAVPIQYLDSPATTSALTYTVYFRSTANSGSYTCGFGGNTYTAQPVMVMILMEIAA